MNIKGTLIGLVLGLILTVLSFFIYRKVTEDNQIVPFQWDETSLEYKTPNNLKQIWTFSKKSIYVRYPNSSIDAEYFVGHWDNNKTFVVDREGPNEYKFDVTSDMVVLRINETPQAKFIRLKKQ